MSTHLQDILSIKQLKGVNSWDGAISAAEMLLRALEDRAKILNSSIRTLKEMRDSGRTFPNGFESTLGLLGQKEDLGQSPAFWLCTESPICTKRRQVAQKKATPARARIRAI